MDQTNISLIDDEGTKRISPSLQTSLPSQISLAQFSDTDSKPLSGQRLDVDASQVLKTIAPKEQPSESVFLNNKPSLIPSLSHPQHQSILFSPTQLAPPEYSFKVLLLGDSDDLNYHLFSKIQSNGTKPQNVEQDDVFPNYPQFAEFIPPNSSHCNSLDNISIKIIKLYHNKTMFNIQLIYCPITTLFPPDKPHPIRTQHNLFLKNISAAILTFDLLDFSSFHAVQDRLHLLSGLLLSAENPYYEHFQMMLLGTNCNVALKDRAVERELIDDMCMHYSVDIYHEVDLNNGHNISGIAELMGIHMVYVAKRLPHVFKSNFDSENDDDKSSQNSLNNESLHLFVQEESIANPSIPTLTSVCFHTNCDIM